MSVLDGKVAIVTRTSRGVGVGIAHELLRVSCGAAKSGLNHPTRSLAKEWGPHARQLRGTRADHHRELPVVRATPG